VEGENTNVWNLRTQRFDHLPGYVVKKKKRGREAWKENSRMGSRSTVTIEKKPLKGTQFPLQCGNRKRVRGGGPGPTTRIGPTTVRREAGKKKKLRGTKVFNLS